MSCAELVTAPRSPSARLEPQDLRALPRRRSALRAPLPEPEKHCMLRHVRLVVGEFVG